MIVQFNSEASSVKIFGVKLDFVSNEVMRIRTAESIDTEFIYGLSY